MNDNELTTEGFNALMGFIKELAALNNTSSEIGAEITIAQVTASASVVAVMAGLTKETFLNQLSEAYNQTVVRYEQATQGNKA